MQVSRLSAAAAASKVQLSVAASAVKCQQALVQKLQSKLTKLQDEEAEHKHQVAERHEQLRHLQEQQAAAEQRLAAVRRAAAHTAGQACSAAMHRKHKGTDSKPAMQHASAVSDEDLDSRNTAKMVKDKKQQMAAAAAKVAELQAVHYAAAARDTYAAASLQGLRASAVEAQAAVASSSQQLEQAVAALQQVAAAAAAGIDAVQQAEQQWKAAQLHLRELQVRPAHAECVQHMLNLLQNLTARLATCQACAACMSFEWSCLCK